MKLKAPRSYPCQPYKDAKIVPNFFSTIRKTWQNVQNRLEFKLQLSQHQTLYTMNAHALLTSQGWRGTGHSLHPTSDSTGLSRPLLVSSKNNNLGIGKKQHKTSDMWWMNAFDKSLKGLDTSVEGQVKQTVTSGGLDMVMKGGARFVGNKGGLYASFVKGEVLGGTLPESISMEEFAVKVPIIENGERSKKKRKFGDVESESKEDRRARKAAKRAVRAGLEEPTPLKLNDREISGNTEGREERSLRRSIKRAKNAQKSISKNQEPEELDADELKKEKKAQKAKRREKKSRKALRKVSPLEEAAEGYPSKSETKEERRERRQKKKTLEAAERSADEDIPEKPKKKRRKE